MTNKTLPPEALKALDAYIKKNIRDAVDGKLPVSILSPSQAVEGYSYHVGDGRAKNAYEESKCRWLEKVKRDYFPYKMKKSDFDNAHEIIKHDFFIRQHNERNKQATKYHNKEITKDECEQLLNDFSTEHHQEFINMILNDFPEDLHSSSLGLAYFASVKCFDHGVPLALHGPLAIEMGRHMINNDDDRGIELQKMFYLTTWQTSNDILANIILPKSVSRVVGQKGGRPKHMRQEEALSLAQALLNNKSESLSAISEDVFILLKNKYTDYPKLPTVRKWISKLEGFTK